jgi:hypothetical protein
MRLKDINKKDEIYLEFSLSRLAQLRELEKNEEASLTNTKYEIRRVLNRIDEITMRSQK